VTLTPALLLTDLEWQAVRLSVWVAAAAVLITLPPGVLMGWVLARFEFRGKVLVETLVHLPLVLPPVVTGYLLLVMFGTRGWLGGALEQWLGVRLIFDWKGAALAAAVVSFPLMVRSIRIALLAVDPRLEAVARTLGAGPIDTFVTVSLPLAWHGVVSGAVLAFARSLGEFGATIMIAGSIPGQTQTIPLLIYQLLESPGGGAVATRLVLVAVGLAVAALLVSETLERRARRALPVRHR